MNSSPRQALIVGGSKGLGLAIAKRLAAEGACLVICGRNQGALDAAADVLRSNPACAGVHTIRADLSVRAEVDDLLKVTYRVLGSVDCLILNSGHMRYGTIETLEDADWDHAYELLLVSAVRLSREVVKRMKDEGVKGDILLISSAGIHEEPGHLLLSGVMRAGIAVLAKHLSHQLVGTGIRVNVVAPGYFDTGRVHERIETLVVNDGIDRAVAIERVAGANPMKRVGRAEEVAELVAFMLGDRAKFLNGTTIVIDGGSSRLVT